MAKSKATKVKGLRPLRSEWQVFIERLLHHGNKTQAYMEAYPKATKQSAYNCSRVLLKHNPQIRAALAAEGADQRARTRLSSDQALRELARIAFADPLDLLDPVTGNMLPLAQVGMNARRALGTVKMVKSTTTVNTTKDGNTTTETFVTECVQEYKFVDKLGALDKMLKHFGLLKDPTPLEELLNQLPPYLQREIQKALAQEMPEALKKITDARAEAAAARALLEIVPTDRRVPNDRAQFRSEN